MTSNATAPKAPTAPSETIKGRLVRVLAEKGAWFAGRIETPEGRVVPIAGVAPSGPPPLESGVELDGKFQNKPPYGEQFNFTALRYTLPATREGIVSYLCTLPGIGERRAQAIYNAWGKDSIQRIQESPADLRKIPGLGKSIDDIAEKMEREKSSLQCDVQLHAMGFGPRTIEKIKERFADKVAKDEPQHYKRLRTLLATNPYALIEVERVSFTLVDNAAMALGKFPDNSPFRAAAAIAHALDERKADGHTWTPESSLEDALGKLKLARPIPQDAIEGGVARGVQDGLLVRLPDVDGIALARLAEAEAFVAEALVGLVRNAKGRPHGSIDAVPADVLSSLLDEQRGALGKAIASPVSVLTGGPGTGKTFTTKAIIAAVKAGGLIVLAPTGKAAKRANEVTGHESSTIHRFISKVRNAFGDGPGEVDPDDDGPSQVVPRTIVIDEASMLDIELLAELLRTCRRANLRIVFVGDIDQLPAVGPGRVLGDLIDSGVVPVTRLSRVMRQAAESRIIANAHACNRGLELDHSATSRGDWHFVQGAEVSSDADDDEKHAAQVDLRRRIVGTVLRARDAKRLDVYRDIQVLSGQRASLLGVEELNRVLREALNPCGPDDDPKAKFRVGDKVLCTRNDYGLGVVNGDCGRVVEVRPAMKDAEGKTVPELVRVLLDDDRDVPFEGEQTHQLVQAWATSVHKSQGSEYKLVIVVLHTCMYWSLQRCLAYTAITRGKECVVIAGTAKALAIALKNSKPQVRNTRLARLLRAAAAEAGLEVLECA